MWMWWHFQGSGRLREGDGCRCHHQGIQAISDYEFEIQLAQTNYSLYDGVETVFLVTRQRVFILSSSMVKEVASFNGDVSGMVAPMTASLLKDKFDRE